jgi:hypothetical protein
VLLSLHITFSEIYYSTDISNLCVIYKFLLQLWEEKEINMGAPFQGIVQDVKGRAKCYKQDWVGGIYSGFR